MTPPARPPRYSRRHGFLGHYILAGRKPLPAINLLAWAQWFEKSERRVAPDIVGDVRVSTVFLGIDHQYGDGPPLLFETMVFGGPLDQEADRCSTWEQAVEMHAAMLARVTAAVAA
jgi:hypothetical protein